MVCSEIVQFFADNCDATGLPCVTTEKWKQLIATYSKDEIRDALAEYIHTNNISFPLIPITENEMGESFRKFSARSHMNQYKHFPVVKERYDYKYKYSDSPLGVIDKSHVFNEISNFFQQENRMKCGSNSSPAPLEIWNDQEKLSKMNWIFWREGVMENSDLDGGAFRAAFRLGTYTATQFKPSVAKALYEKHKARNVLDTSCGWGDRLAGFYGTPCTTLYVGCDPNPDVFAVYLKQCVAYERLLGVEPVIHESEDYFECVGKKTVKIWRKPAEDVDWSEYKDTFDFYFTSPPYFETEKYASDTEKTCDQSWNRYSSFDAWKNDFFFAVTKQVWDTIKQKGYMMINIIEPRSRQGTRFNLCDDMVEEFKQLKDSNYIGKIGMRMMARPNTTELEQIFIEPVWVFRKGTTEYKTLAPSTLESFFDV